MPNRTLLTDPQHPFSCDVFLGYHTDLYTDIVYCITANENCGSMPREVYEDDPEYIRRSKLHAELVPIIRELLEQLCAERTDLERERSISLEVKRRLIASLAQRDDLLDQLMNELWLGVDLG